MIALVSTILGLLGGAIPDLISYFKRKQEYKQELLLLEKQAEVKVALMQAGLDVKLAEAQAQTAVEEVRAFGKQLEAIYAQQKSIGIRWIDGWNAALRPMACSVILVLFTMIAYTYAFGAFYGAYSLIETANAIWASLVGDAIQSVLGYLFGYRTTSSAVQAIREGRRPVVGMPWTKK